MEPIQLFINEHPKCKGPRGKVLQSLINRHVQPRPMDPGHVTGVLCPRPPITISRCLTGKHIPGSIKLLPQMASWTAFVPLHLRNDMFVTMDACWLMWLQHYIVHTLRATPLKKNLIRSYVSHTRMPSNTSYAIRVRVKSDETAAPMLWIR